ncbi:MAG TPA: cupin domain-containing protein [Candidatus Thalassarchaeaceae archaeon]|nr:MAG TPA: cupin domain-containing protein [Candidatus Poseidoniales archaeon]HII48917.1 cupin domain-containing protein [Candidatus Thalassarchaeaceae archaeon]
MNLRKKFGLFRDLWSPKVVGEINDYQVKLAKIEGEFVWHQHDHTDEFFLVVEGSMRIEYENHHVSLDEGDIHIVPKGIRHRTVAYEECWIVIIEPRDVVNTGDVDSDMTAENDVWI